MTSTEKKPLTRWGDKEARRADILEAARGIIKEKGFQSLNMREVAKRAGVSPGAPYFYFKTKEEIFLTVYSGCIDSFAEQVVFDCKQCTSVLTLFKAVAASYIDFYRDYGRHLNMWSVLSDPQSLANLPTSLITQLKTKVTEIFGMLAIQIDALAKNEGIELKEGRLTLTLLWIVLGGFAENFSGPKPEAFPYDWDEMLDFAGRTLIKGLSA